MTKHIIFYEKKRQSFRVEKWENTVYVLAFGFLYSSFRMFPFDASSMFF